MQNILATQKDYNYLLKKDKEMKQNQMRELGSVLKNQIQKKDDEKKYYRKMSVDNSLSNIHNGGNLLNKNFIQNKKYKCGTCKQDYPQKYITKRKLRY